MKRMHAYNKIVQLLETVRDDTKKHCCFVTNVYDHRPDIGLELYLEDGWTKDAYHTRPVSTLDEAVEFLEDFLWHRATVGLLFKRF